MKMKRHIPDGGPTGGSASVDGTDVIGDGIRGIDVVLDEVLEVEFIGLDVDWLVVWVDWLSINSSSNLAISIWFFGISW